MIVFEFFSGVGGIHQALIKNNIPIKGIFPYDINPNANQTYQHNFNIKPFEISLESFSVEDYENILKEFNIETNFNNILWTMSPPCQPFSRQGNIKDLEDDRTNGFKNLLLILEKTKYPPNYFFLENVKNFELSEACIVLIKVLLSRNFYINQFLLSPIIFGVPNSRLRYYLTARLEKKFNFLSQDIIDNEDLLNKCYIKTEKPIEIYKFINFNEKDEESQLKKELYLIDKVLTKESSMSMDLVSLNDKSSNCFTKGYSKMFKGTGSILLLDTTKYKQNDLLSLAGIARYFTPDEVMQFMCFVEKFSFPDKLSIKSRYKLLGNSVNVKVVSILLDYLLKSN